VLTPGAAVHEDDGLVVAEPDPAGVRRIHLVGIAGTGMGSFAGMLKTAGYAVTGSDQNVYPPMSEMLAAWGISALTPYAPANLDAARPDLAVIGNVIRRVNPEATEVRHRRIAQTSFPAALRAFFLRDRHPVVVVGTHGKTTTSALMAHVLLTAGRDPAFLVGGVTRNTGTNFRLGAGPHFVVEGDEYDTAYFDKGPKFLHYQPRTAILTSVEFDHADIYRDLAHYESAFAGFVRLIPADGLLAVSAAYPNALRLARDCAGRVVTYGGAVPGLDRRAAGDVSPRPSVSEVVVDYAAGDVALGPDGARFEVWERGRPLGVAALPVGGAHNVENALGVVAAARGLGLAFEEIRPGLATFTGVRRRQEVRATIGGVTVVDDFAHHPTAVRETIAATRARYPCRRLWAVFEPRSNTSRRRIHQEDYHRALAQADRVSLRVPEPHDKVPAAEQLDVPRLVAALRGQGIAATGEAGVEALVREVADGARPGDVVLVMSNGAFGGFVDALTAALDPRASPASAVREAPSRPVSQGRAES
jgi:UDP-N-acetylmuramate: L-alanyl-gamma-D-glutamyl-meso-diaminopimelate ligase